MLNVFIWSMIALLWFNAGYSNADKRNKTQAYLNILAGFFCTIVAMVLLVM